MKLPCLGIAGFLATAAAVACSVQSTTNTTPAGPADAGGAIPDSAPDAGSAIDAAEDAGDPVDPTYPTAHTPIPLVDYNGGAVMVAPKIVTITFGNDPLRARLEQFGDTITATPWWDAVREGYCAPEKSTTCVGRGSGGGHVNIATAPPSQLTDSSNGSPSSVQDYLQARIADGTLPTPTPDTLYAVYLPSGVSVELDGNTSCKEFGAYHNTLNVKAGDAGTDVAVPYAIMPRCDATEKTATIAASHEFIEAATDPNVGNNSVGFYMTDQVWGFAGGEVGDVCVDLSGNGQDTYNESGFFVQRSWSNTAAQSSHDPCVPAPEGQPYFNAAPAKGQNEITLAVGASTTIEVTAFSDAPMADDWDLSAIDFNQFTTGKPTLKFALDKSKVHNGSKVKLTVTLTANPGQYALFALVSKSGKTRHLWPVAVIKK